MHGDDRGRGERDRVFTEEDLRRGVPGSLELHTGSGTRPGGRGGAEARVVNRRFDLHLLFVDGRALDKGEGGGGLRWRRTV